MSEFHTEMARVQAVVTLSDGTAAEGAFFVAAASPTHAGPMRVKDLLNLESGFFPFEVGAPGKGETTIFNRAHLVMVTLADREEPRTDAGYDVATTRQVAVRLSTGDQVSGAIRIYRPKGHQRTSDYARDQAERFRYLEGADKTMIVNMAHVLQITEIPE